MAYFHEYVHMIYSNYCIFKNTDISHLARSMHVSVKQNLDQFVPGMFRDLTMKDVSTSQWVKI